MKKIFLIVILGLWATAGIAEAASIGFSTTRSLFDAEILPGTTYQDELLIFNNSQDLPLPIHLQLSVWDLAEGSEETIMFTEAEEQIDPLKWFSLVTSGGATPREPATLKPLASGYDFILSPGEEKLLRFRVTPPRDVAAGTYLVSMRLIAAVPEHYFEAIGPRSLPEMGILFFLKVPFFSLDGTQTTYAAEILDVGLKSEIQTQPGIVQVAKADILDDAAKVIAAKVKNIGAFYFKASGVLRLESWTGRVVKEIPLPPKYMLPGKTRTLEISLAPKEDRGFWGQIGQYVSDNAYLGRYTATIILNYPQTGAEPDFTAGSFTQKSFSFWIFPWKFILVMAAITALITFIVKRFGSRIAAAGRIDFRLGRGK
jgi:hypothetical protein